MESQEILSKMRDAYSSFDSYTDIGTVESPDGPAPRIKFRTHFKRPRSFRFGWTIRHPDTGQKVEPEEQLIWTNGEKYWRYMIGEVEQQASLSSLTEAASAMSRGAASIISHLLIPDSQGKKDELLHNGLKLTDLALLGEDDINGVSCFHLAGESFPGSRTEAWIETDRYVVRRLRLINEITEEMGLTMKSFIHEQGFVDNFRVQAAAFGLSDQPIEQTVQGITTMVYPSKKEQTYTYSSVAINESLDCSLFICR